MGEICKYKAFSLIEIVIIVGVFAVTVALLVPFAFSQIKGSKIAGISSELFLTVQSAQQNAYAAQGEEPFGIAFKTDVYYLFRGTGYSNAVSVEAFPLPEGIEFTEKNLVSNGDEIVFFLGSLYPSTVGTVTMSDGEVDFVLSVNEEGLIDIYKR